MGTKADPGPFDCYAALEPDEPYFLLRANDPEAPAIVEAWIAKRAVRGVIEGLRPRTVQKLAEAEAVAAAMRAWRSAKHGA